MTSYFDNKEKIVAEVKIASGNEGEDKLTTKITVDMNEAML